GIDAAAEIRIEVARSEHLEAHDDRTGDEGDGIDRGGRGDIRGDWCRFDGGVLHEGPRRGEEKAGQFRRRHLACSIGSGQPPRALHFPRPWPYTWPPSRPRCCPCLCPCLGD